MRTLSYNRLYNCFQENPDRIHEVLMWARNDTLDDYCPSTVYILVHSYYDNGYDEQDWLRELMNKCRTVEFDFSPQGNDFFAWMKENKWKRSGNNARLRLSRSKRQDQKSSLADNLEDKDAVQTETETEAEENIEGTQPVNEDPADREIEDLKEKEKEKGTDKEKDVPASSSSSTTETDKKEKEEFCIITRDPLACQCSKCVVKYKDIRIKAAIEAVEKKKRADELFKEFDWVRREELFPLPMEQLQRMSDASLEIVLVPFVVWDYFDRRDKGEDCCGHPYDELLRTRSRFSHSQNDYFLESDDDGYEDPASYMELW
jgi:hypothetical protein